MCEQVFDLFDSKKDGMIDFGEFVKALSVFHPAAPQPQKAACKSSYLKRVCLSQICALI
jgi:Ca2+-binding EF-hand superfamily protein